MRTQIPVDHVIFYAGCQVESYASLLERLGFIVTPLGYHDSGSVNRLVVLDGVYLEIVGFLPGTPADVRPELRACAEGFNGIAFAELPGTRRIGLDQHFKAPASLSRPVQVDGSSREARFRLHTMKCGLEQFRIFLCHHLTPELIWRDVWMRHTNSTMRLCRIELPAGHEPRLRAPLAAALDLTPPAFRVDDYRARDLDIAFTDKAIGEQPPAHPQALQAMLFFEIGDEPALRASLEAGGLVYRKEGKDTVVDLTGSMGATFAFRSRGA